MKWENEVTRTLKIKYPIVQAPMLGVTTPEMVAAISNQGGLGSLPVGGLSPEKTKDLIQKTKALTASPFAVNLFANRLPKNPDKIKFDLMQDLLVQICRNNDLCFERRSFDSLQFYSYTEQIDCLLGENIPVVSFTFGTLDSESIRALKERGIILIGTATCLKEAKILDQIGIDIVTAQGIEAGGHRGTFLENEPLSAIGLISLIPQLVERISRPILAAGGINDGKTIKAAFILGAQGVQPGTAFIASDESGAIPSYKKYLRDAVDTDSILTRSLSGRWARGLKNKFITEIEKSELLIPEYPIQVSLTSAIRIAAQQQNNREFTTLWAGQSAFKSEMKPIVEIFTKLIKETEEIG
ncbi:MAG: nitronate monooxygenase [Ginsengibacter sp.]